MNKLHREYIWEPSVPALNDDERGLVVMQPVSPTIVPGQPYIYRNPRPPVVTGLRFNSKRLDPLTRMYGLTFFDRLVWPVCGLMGMSFGQLSRDDEILVSEGLLNISEHNLHGLTEIVEIDGDGIRSSGQQNEQIVGFAKANFDALSQRDAGRWTVSSESHQLISLISDQGRSGLAFSLARCVPIVTDCKDFHAFLRWREDRSCERREFMSALTDFSAGIDTHEQPFSELEKKKGDLGPKDSRTT